MRSIQSHPDHIDYNRNQQSSTAAFDTDSQHVNEINFRLERERTDRMSEKGSPSRDHFQSDRSNSLFERYSKTSAMKRPRGQTDRLPPEQDPDQSPSVKRRRREDFSVFDRSQIEADRSGGGMDIAAIHETWEHVNRLYFQTNILTLKTNTIKLHRCRARFSFQNLETMSRPVTRKRLIGNWNHLIQTLAKGLVGADQIDLNTRGINITIDGLKDMKSDQRETYIRTMGISPQLPQIGLPRAIIQQICAM